MGLLRNRSFQVKVVKDQKAVASADGSEEPNIYVNVEIAAAYADILKDVVTHSALVIGGVWAACKIIERICR